MGNMSYCRFENTFRDMQDCQNALDDKGLRGMSSSEKKYAKRLIEMCKEIVDNHEGLLDEDDSDEDEDED